MVSESKLSTNYEKDYYPCVARWFETQKGCTSVSLEHLFGSSTLLSADVVGWMGEVPQYACEMKPYPLPIGSSGYGSIGQALMLKHYARQVYIGGVASERVELDRGQVIHWERVLRKSSTKSLLRLLNLNLPEDFDGLCDAATSIFRTYFGSLGLGFLLVHERHASDDPLLSCDVVELVKPGAF